MIPTPDTEGKQMRFPVTFGGTALALALAFALPSTAMAAAAAQPSFDCAKAATQVEKTICASDALAKADTDIARIYQERLRAFDPATARLLVRDQTRFLASREHVFGPGFGDAKPAKLLLDLLKDRAKFLRGLRLPAGDGLVGHWANVTGLLAIRPGANGHIDIGMDTNEPVTARWVCSLAGTGRVVDGVLEVQVEDGSALRLKREGQAVTVKAVPPTGKTDWMPDYCGMNGSVEGTYFPTAPSK